MSEKRVSGGSARGAGGRALGLVKLVVVGGIVLFVVAAGAWKSWNDSQDTFRDNREQGTLTVRSCGSDKCTGTFVPSGDGRVRTGVSIDKSVTHRTGERLDVAVRPGTKTVVRTGAAGVLHAYIPLGGALLLASLIIAGGLGLGRVGLAVGVAGAVLVGASFLAL